ncbi:MAG: tRNA (adenosine(37)-N6)-dimethylallyltransferase MiaA [bacterium]|nr:tRNA (adenosine(37)-N6)-dimethylallyltransferase MiaA [bacterium]
MVQKMIELLIGETASGKTSYIEGRTYKERMEVLNCDSRQIYRGFDIGTAKPSRELLNRVRHHLIDIINITDDFSAGEFLKLSESILKREENIIVSAGTPFYLNVLLNGIDEIPKAKLETRKMIEEMHRERGNSGLHEFLSDVDPVRASQLNVNDTQRIKRSLEVYLDTGIPISRYFRKQKKAEINFGRITYIRREKRILEERVRERVKIMLAKGFIEEAEALIKKHGPSVILKKPIIGYVEALEYIEGNIDRERMIEEIIRNTMGYIKRQRIFFKKILLPFADIVEYIE